MDTVRPSIENALKRDHIHIVMNTDGPDTRDDSVSQYQINWERNKVAASKYRYCLQESIDWVKCKSRKRGYSFGFMMNNMKFIIDERMMKQAMDPICEELIINQMKEDINWKHKGQIPVVLDFRVVRIAHFYQSNQRSLHSDVYQ